MFILMNAPWCYRAGKENQGPLPGGSKFCSWVSENGSLVVRWASEISLSSLVNDSFQSKTISKFMTAR